jgi:hypothetical protein
MNLAQTQQQTRRSLLNFQTPGVHAKSSMGLFFVFLTLQIFDCELAQHIGTDSYLSGRGSGPKMGYVGKTGYQCLTRNESWQLLVLAPNACVWTLVLVVCCQKCDPLVF